MWWQARPPLQRIDRQRACGGEWNPLRTGKAEVKPESASALEEVVKLLKQDAKLNLYVVGHTDNVGALAVNVDLSKRRVPPVVESLITQHGISANRLLPYGDGPYVPLVSNDSEDGRAANRRVELVKR